MQGMKIARSVHFKEEKMQTGQIFAAAVQPKTRPPSVTGL